MIVQERYETTFNRKWESTNQRPGPPPKWSRCAIDDPGLNDDDVIAVSKIFAVIDVLVMKLIDRRAAEGTIIEVDVFLEGGMQVLTNPFGIGVGKMDAVLPTWEAQRIAIHPN
jgi:hypothetical protein